MTESSICAISFFELHPLFFSTQLNFCFAVQDLLVGFDFAPIVFFNDNINSLELDLGLVHDVKEQSLGKGKVMYALSDFVNRHTQSSKFQTKI